MSNLNEKQLSEQSNWPADDRRKCYYDPQQAARLIGQYLAADRAARRRREQAEVFERRGRQVTKLFLLFCGAFCIWLIGRGHETVMEFLTWFVHAAIGG